MKLTSVERLWLAGAAIVALLMVVIGYFFFISPQRSKTSDINGQLSDAQLQNSGLQARITQLTSDRARMEAYKAALDEAHAALPTVADKSATPALLRSLQSIANATSTRLSAVTVGQPTGLAATASVSSTPVVESSSASSSSTTTAPTVAATPPPTMYAVPVTAVVSGNYDQLRGFLTQLQSVQPRAVLVTAITVGEQAPAATSTQKTVDARTSMSLTMDVFAVPDSNASSLESPAAAVVTPGAAPTAAVGAAPAPSPSASP